MVKGAATARKACHRSDALDIDEISVSTYFGGTQDGATPQDFRSAPTSRIGKSGFKPAIRFMPGWGPADQ